MSRQAVTMRGPAAEPTADELLARRFDDLDEPMDTDGDDDPSMTSGTHATFDDILEAVDRRFEARYERAYVAAKQRAFAATRPKELEKASKKRRAAVEPTTPRPTKKAKTKADKKELVNLKDELIDLIKSQGNAQMDELGRVQDRLHANQAALARHVTSTMGAVEAQGTELLAGQAELRRGQVAVAQHVTSERVATANAMRVARHHEAELPAIFLSHIILTDEMAGLPIDELEPIPDGYEGDLHLYLRDTVTNRVIVASPYPLPVPHGSWCREFCHDAINCVMSTLLSAVAFGAGIACLVGLAPTAPSTVRTAQKIAETVVSYILPVPSAQDARKGLRIKEILKIGDPDLKYGGSTTIINQGGDKVLRGTVENIAAYKQAMAATAGDFVRMA